MKEQKCLVTEAMDKCNCENCIQNRKFRQLAIKFWVQNQIAEVFREAFRTKDKELLK